MINIMETKSISVPRTLLETLSEIGSILAKLTDAYDKITALADEFEDGDIYCGNATEDFQYFFALYSSHLESIIRLYKKSYDFQSNVVLQFLDLDETISNQLSIGD